ncbi:MAG: PKD domain-containing protein, partial [Thermoplasmata archaeon]
FYNDTTVENGITYFYKVAAVNKIGQGPYSDIINATPTLPFNAPPSVTISADKTKGKAPLTVTFTGAASDVDGTIASYMWNFGDGNFTYTKNPEYTFEEPGVYVVKLTVTDDLGKTGTDNITITVYTEDDGSEDGDGDKKTGEEESKRSYTTAVALTAVVIVVIVLVLIWFLFMKKKQRREEDEEVKAKPPKPKRRYKEDWEEELEQDFGDEFEDEDEEDEDEFDDDLPQPPPPPPPPPPDQGNSKF